jgi:superfamily II DNA or RNA helicase
MAYLGKKGYTLYKDKLSVKELYSIRNDLNVKPYSTHSGNVVSYPIYRESNHKIYLPRYYGVEQFGNYSQNVLSKGDIIDLTFRGELFDYQHNIIDKYIKHVGDSGGGLLDVEPGKGKTVMALNIISKLNKKTLVIVHKSFLMNQWIERIEQFLPNAKVGKIQGEHCDVEGKDIVLGMLQSLSSKTYDDHVLSSFGLCVFDECHHLSAEVFSNVMIQFVCNYNLGLSGTMTRKDGLTKVFKYFIGPVIHKEKTDLTVDVKVKTIHYDEELFDKVKTDFRGNPLYSTMISTLCEYKPRTLCLVEIIRNEFILNPYQQMMILAHNKCLIQELYDLIVLFEPSVGFYLGGMKENLLKESESKKIIIATYAMASEGLDIKTLTTLFMATPKSDVCQSVGRILRSKHSTPLVIDIVDNHTIFKNQYKKRKAYYSKKKYNIEAFTNLNQYFKNEKETIKNKSCLLKL